MGCKFCASTLGGLVRRLRPSELLDQVLFSQIDSGLPISNIVLMGIGEPLDNFDAVMQFLELVNSPDGLNIGMRHISLSTCGLVDKIRLLAERKLQLTPRCRFTCRTTSRETELCRSINAGTSKKCWRHVRTIMKSPGGGCRLNTR